MSEPESLEAQVRALTDLVKQLQADNERLRGNQPSGDGGPSVTQPSSLTATTSASGQTATERLVCLPRERKCPRFSGKRSVDNISVEDWIEEVRRSLSARPGPPLDKALFVYDLLDGEAKREVKFSPSADRNDPEKIFTILKENFRCSKTLNTLYRQFYHRRQQESESVREYSHVLMELMEQIKDRDDNLDNGDHVLRDQFVEGLRDDKLQGDLLDKISANGTLTFRDTRREALEWLNRRTQPSRARAYSCNSYEADANAVTVGPTSEFAELKEGLRNHQVQLEAILSHLRQPHAKPNSAQRPSSQRPQPRYTADGKPICLRCNKAGHIARVCRAVLPVEPGPGPVPYSGSSGGVSGERDGEVASSAKPQEN